MPSQVLVASQSATLTAASSIPPAVNDAGAAGAANTYARGDHTHASSVQAARVPVVGNSGSLTWTFPRPFDVGVVPVITATAENAAGALFPLIVNVAGTPTNTSVTFTCFRTMSVTLPTTATALLGLVINPFGYGPAGTFINIIARKPS